MTTPLWHLAINTLAGRKGRTTLLACAVALATALTVAMGVAIDTFEGSVRLALGQMVGTADLRIRQQFGARLDNKTLEKVRSWPETKLAAPRFSTGVSLKLERTGQIETLVAEGIDPDLHERMYPMKLAEGRTVTRAGECVIDQKLQERIGAVVGDELKVVRFGDPIVLKVVGIADRPPLEVLQRRVAVVTLGQVQQIAELSGLYDQIDLQLTDPMLSDKVTAKYKSTLGPGVMIETSASASAGINRAMVASRFGLVVISTLVFLCAVFIIITGLTTAVSQRTRELAILRCIGTPRWMVATSQVLAGGLLALCGALAGVPVGIGMAYVMYLREAHVLKGGFIVGYQGVALAVLAAVVAGTAGAVYPAVVAASVSPLRALASVSHKPRFRGVAWVTGLALVLLAVQPMVLRLPWPAEKIFWLNTALGLPTLFLGVFLLSVPVCVVLAWGLTPVLARVLRVPVTLLRQSVLATPFRHAFTGGALMVGLAMLLVIWTNMRGAISNYFSTVKMPDGFVHSFNSLTQQQYDNLKSVSSISAICPTTMFPVDPKAQRFGLAGISPTNTQFVASDIHQFVKLTDMTWVQGDEHEALAKMDKGRAVLVSREYLIAHGLGVGGTVRFDTPFEGPVDFEVVGVVASPGLDLAVHVFGIQRAYADASVSCVFGTRQDAYRYFGVGDINLVLFKIDPGVSDFKVLSDIRDKVPGVKAGTSRQILENVNMWLARVLAAASAIAIASMVIACLGVGNLIVANIAARRFEYGVVRAVGSSRGMLGRLIVGETVVIALVGCACGSLLAWRIALIASRFDASLMGLVYPLRVPWAVVGWGYATVILAALLAALPATVGLMRSHPRVLLAGARG